MATRIKNDIEEKKCSKCDIWKPCSDFPKDASKAKSQCFTHCVCKNCRNKS